MVLHSGGPNQVRAGQKDSKIGEKTMAYIRVLYQTGECDFDYVPGSLLAKMITLDEISHFYRPSEKRWVSVKFDTIRQEGGRGPYHGPERRMNASNPEPEDPEGRRFKKGSAKPANWLEALWSQIEAP